MLGCQAHVATVVNSTVLHIWKLPAETLRLHHKKKKVCDCVWRWVLTRLVAITSQYTRVSNHCVVHRKLTWCHMPLTLDENDWNTHIHPQKEWTRLCSAAIFTLKIISTSKTWKQSKSSPIEDWIYRPWYNHPTDYKSAKKRNKGLTHATQMNLRNITMSKRPDTKSTWHVIPCIWTREHMACNPVYLNARAHGM